jgi:hypothetical protein
VVASDLLVASLAVVVVPTLTLVVIPDSSVEDTLVVSTSHDHMALMMTMTTLRVRVRTKTRITMTRSTRVKKMTTSTQHPLAKRIPTRNPPEEANIETKNRAEKPTTGWSILYDATVLTSWRQLSCFHGKW